MAEPKTKRNHAPKLTDAERHKRFIDMAKEVGASDNPEDFDKAFHRVTSGDKETIPATSAPSSQKIKP